MPASRAACTSPALSSTTPHQSVAMVQTPKPTSETWSSLLPKRRYRMGCAPRCPRLLPGQMCLRVLDDRPRDRTRPHVLEGVVHAVERDLGRDELVEHQLPLSIEPSQCGDVTVHVRRAVPAAADLLLHDDEA